MRLWNIQAVMIMITAFFNGNQAQELKGIILSESNTPIADVSVIFQNQLIATTTAEGTFFLTADYKLPMKLTLEHVDYESKTIILSQSNQRFYLTSSVKPETLHPVLVSAIYERKSTVITPTSTIGSEAIAQQSPVDIVSSINQTPGVYIQSGAINTNRIVIRGVGSRTLYGTNKIRAYFNDIPITNDVGETAIDIYDPEDLQSIEIVKGPKASIYGTNLGGTLLLRSKSPENEGFSVRNNTTIGSFGLFKNAVSTDYSTAKLHLHFAYDHLEMDGFRSNSNYNRNGYFLNASYQIDGTTELSLLVNQTDYNAHIPSSIGKTAFEEDPSQAAFTWQQAQGYEQDAQTLVGVGLKHQFSEDFSTTTSVFYVYSDHYEPRPFNILDEFTNGFGFRTVFNKRFEFLNRDAEWTFGSELFKDEYHWNTIENLYEDTNGNGSLEGRLWSSNEEYRQQLNIFTSLTLPVLDKLILQFGFNFNKTAYDFQDEFQSEETNTSAARHFDAIIAPNINVKYQYNPNHSLYANVSYGFNYPSLEEALTPEGVVNPEISPEKGFNYEVGSESYFFNKNWHVVAAVYLLDIKDLLVAQRVGDDQYIGRNAGQTLHRGLELSTDYKFRITKSLRVSPYVNASFNWHRFEHFVSDNSDFSGNKLTGVPEVTVASGIGFQFKNIALYGTHLFVGDLPMNDANTLYSDAYHLMNLKFTYDTQLFKIVNFRLNFGINNVFDKRYASAILINATGFNNSEPRYYYPGNPRNYYGGISMTLYL